MRFVAVLLFFVSCGVVDTKPTADQCADFELYRPVLSEKFNACVDVLDRWIIGDEQAALGCYHPGRICYDDIDHSLGWIEHVTGIRVAIDYSRRQNQQKFGVDTYKEHRTKWLAWLEEYEALPFPEPRDAHTALLPFHTYGDYFLCEGGFPLKLTAEDFAVIDSCILDGMAHFNQTFNPEYQTALSPPADYGRQYVAGVCLNGYRMVWVNCYVIEFPEEEVHDELYQVFDGGSGYFNLYVNLSTKTYRDFEVNPGG